MEGFSFSELVLIVIVAIIIYGKDLPQAARKMATIYSKFKRQLNDVRDEIKRQIPMEELENAVKIDLPSGPGGEPPHTPFGLHASPGASNVLLTWNPSPGSTSYTIRRSTAAQDPWLIIAMNITELAWTDTDVQPGKTYHYTVTGANDTGESGNSDEVTATIPGGDALPAAAAAAAPPAPETAAPAPAVPPPAPTAAAAPANGNGDYPKEPPLPEEKGQPSAPEVKPS
ncbi:MAG TPA: fibronectin type III domain-containing protein [Planctomycetota bacterium]|nr:fibronectin type III domain-containing protein [Planctomycetota bacterium]